MAQDCCRHLCSNRDHFLNTEFVQDEASGPAKSPVKDKDATEKDKEGVEKKDEAERKEGEGAEMSDEEGSWDYSSRSVQQICA